MIIFFLNMFDYTICNIMNLLYKYTVHIVRTIFTDSFTIFVILSFSIGGTRSFLHRSRCICDHSKRLARGIFGSLFKTWHPGSFRFTCLSRRFFLRHLQWCFFHLQNLFFVTLFFFSDCFVGCIILHSDRFVFVSSHFGELPHAKVWPQKPAFWKNKTLIGHIELSQVGLWIVGAAVGWLEHLNDEAKSGLLVFKKDHPGMDFPGSFVFFLGGFEAWVDCFDF